MTCMTASGDQYESENRNDPLRPPHSRKYAQFTREWYAACERAFKTVMQDELRHIKREMKEAS
jgi:hypothetical protein